MTSFRRSARRNAPFPREAFHLRGNSSRVGRSSSGTRRRTAHSQKNVLQPYSSSTRLTPSPIRYSPPPNIFPPNIFSPDILRFQPIPTAPPQKPGGRAPKARVLPPRGYLRLYQLGRVRSRQLSVELDPPSAPAAAPLPRSILRDLSLPFSLLKRGGIGYLFHLSAAFVIMAAAITLGERVALQILLRNEVIWELPYAVAPFVPLLVGIGLRLLVIPVAVGILALPIRVMFLYGSLDLNRLLEATPQAIRRSCSTSWAVGIKLMRRLIASAFVVTTAIVCTSSKIPASAILLVSVAGAVAYLVVRLPLLCAPLLSILADYGRRYSVQHTIAILDACAMKIRSCMVCFFLAWLTSHLLIRWTIINLFDVSPCRLLWINALFWLWYGITSLSSMVLQQAYEHERRMIRGAPPHR